MTYVNKRKSYLLIEAYDRPFSIFYLSTQSRFFKVFRNEDKILPKYLVYISTFLLFLRRSLSYSSIKLRGYRYNLFLMKYTINRYAYFIQLENRHEIVKINKDIIKNGGIIKYLNLDNSDYVEKLTKNFNWQKNGIEIFSELIEYKYRYGFVCHLILHWYSGWVESERVVDLTLTSRWGGYANSIHVGRLFIILLVRHRER